MNLLPNWVKPGVGNIAYEVRNILQKVIQRLGEIADGFTAVETNLTFNSDQTTVFRGSWGMPVRWVAGTYTIQAVDCVILATAGAVSFTVTLPSPNQYNGQVFIVKKVDSTANRVYISGTADGAQQSTATPYARYIFVAGSSTWNIIN